MNSDIKILVVDDDPDVLYATSRVLRKSGAYTIIEAMTGSEALQMAREQLPDLILLDVVLPDLDGYEVCKELKSNPITQGIMIVLCSGLKTSTDNLVEGLDLGADEYLARPIHNRELLARVKAMIRLKTAEHRLSDRERLLNAIVNGISTELYLISGDYKILWTNVSESKPPGVLTGSNDETCCYQYIAKRTEQCVDCPVEKVLLTGRVQSALITFPGDRIKSCRAEPIIDSDTAQMNVLVIVDDVTEKVKLQEALATEKEQLFVTLKSIGDGVITTDIYGNVIFLNVVARELTGWTQSEAFGKPIEKVFNIVNEYTKEPVEVPVQKVLRTGTIVGLANHTELITKDGRGRIIADSAAPIFTAKKEIIGTVLVFRDITERIRIEEQLRQAHKLEAIGVLAGGLAHDFNNILSIITGNLSILMDDMEQSGDIFDLLAEIRAGARQAQTLTNQMLTFSKGGLPIKKPTSLADLVEETVQFVCRGSNVRCNVSFSGDGWQTDVDPGQINQAISNIVLNAKQAMPEGGTIEIVGENIVLTTDGEVPLPKGEYILISIRDYGMGIPPQHLERIFDPYFTTKQRGNGLGLATTYSIVKKHDGHLTVESVLGEGSVFNLYLPAGKTGLSAPAEDLPIIHHGQGKVLILDDEEAVLRMVGRMLSDMGYSPYFAADGSQAVEIYEKAMNTGDPFKFVILDLTIPGTSGGVATMTELQKLDPQVKGIVSSGYSTDPIMSDYKRYGFCGVIPKPYTKYQLAGLLNSLFENASSP